MSPHCFYENLSSEEVERRIWALDLSSKALLQTTTALYDPILTPIFTAILGTGGITIGASTITYASIATAIATTALTIGLQMLLAPKPPTPEQGKVPLKQPIPYRIWTVGRARLAGSLMLWDANTTGTQLFAIHAMAGHRVKSFNRYWLHDDEVTLQSDGYANAIGSRYKNNSVQILTRRGLNPETAYQPAVDIFGPTGLWTSNHRGDGQASMMVRCNAVRLKDQSARYPYGAPQGSAEIDGAYCWDFRDSAQNPDDQSTWAWTQNSAIICAWHLCLNEFGFNLDYRKALLPVIDLWREEADICDEDVPNAGGGTEKRYQCNGFDTTENGPKSGLNAILATCDGHLVARGDGTRILTVGKFREDRVVTISDADIMGRNIQYDVLFDEECNRLVPKFTYPETDYTTTDTDFFEDTDRQLVSGRVLSQEGNYQWCHHWRQARRLGKRDWLRIQEKARGTLSVRLSGINAIYARWIRLETPVSIPGMNGSLIENRRSTLDLTKGGFSMEFIKHPADIDAWTPATDEGQQPPVPPTPGPDEILTPVINLVQAKANGQTVYLRVVIIDPQTDSYTPVVRYQLADNGTGNPGAWVEQEFPDAVASGGFVELNTNVVPSDQLLNVQVVFQNSRGSRGENSVTATVRSTVDTVAPAALTSFTSSDSAPRLGKASFGITTPNDSHLKTVKLYRKASGAALNVATDTAIATLNVSALSTYTYTDGDTTRTNLLSNPNFDSDTVWTKGTGWAIGAGYASHPSGSASSISQTITLTAGKYYRVQYDILGSSNIASLTPSLFGGTTQSGTGKQANGTFRDRIAAVSGNNAFGFAATAAFVGALDNVILIEETATSAPQGSWDYYAVPFNGSGVAGTPSGPIAVTIV